MTVIDIATTTEDNRSRQFFIRIENFPSTASPRDVKTFFNGLVISPGGIYIRGSNVFVSFENRYDMTAAMARDGHSLLDHKALLSIVERKEVDDIFDRSHQRYLKFESKIQKPEVKDGSPEGPRKIRPTAVEVREQQFKTDMTFAPKEVEGYVHLPELSCTTCKRLSNTPQQRVQRKIMPTAVKCIDDCTSVFKQTMVNSVLLFNE